MDIQDEDRQSGRLGIFPRFHLVPEDDAHELSKLATTFRLAIFRNDAGASKVLIDLFVEVIPVSNDDERLVSSYFSKNLLRKERHGKALAASLRVPEDTEFPLV